MSETPNVGEAEYWRSAQQWVDCQDVLDALLQPVLDLLLSEAALQPGEQVLDIGCGTGASTMAAARIVDAAGHVTGADISAIMLERARTRARAARLENLSFVEADAQHHPFDRATCDAIISRFGVMFFEDPVTAFRNIRQAAIPKGRLVFLCWASLPKNSWFAVPRQAAVDVLGTVPPPEPRAPGPMAFEDRDYVTDILRDAGWGDVAVTESSLILTPKGSVAEVASFATRLGPASRIIKDLQGSEADTARIENMMSKKLEPFVTGTQVRVPALLNLVHARA